MLAGITLAQIRKGISGAFFRGLTAPPESGYDDSIRTIPDSIRCCDSATVWHFCNTRTNQELKPIRVRIRFDSVEYLKNHSWTTKKETLDKPKIS